MIGFIGLGHMGNPMAKNLLKANYPLMVYDINSAAVSSLAQAGATAASIQQIASNCDIIFTMLQTGDQVKAVCLNPEGLFAHAKPNTLFIESSTIDIETSRELHTLAKEKNFRMIDSPVSGGVVGAEAATLTLMVGGDENDFSQAKPLLEKLGKKIIYAGGPGNGQAAKICNNMILGISMIAVSEAFALGEKLGLDPKTFFSIASQASGQCWAMTNYIPVPNILPNVPANHDYKPGFTANMMLKDLNLSQAAAHMTNASTPLGAQATSLYSQFITEGNGNLDFSAIYKMING